MGDRLRYMKFPFKKRPDEYLHDKKVFLLNEVLDHTLEDVMALYMDSFYTQNEELYNEFQEKYNEFKSYLENVEDEELVSEVQDYLLEENETNEFEFPEGEVYLESTKINLDEFDFNEFKDKVPVYAIFTAGSSWYSKVIMKFSRGDYSHAGFSLDGPEEILSFDKGKKSDGLKLENLYEMISDRRPTYLNITALPVSKEVYEKLYRTVYKVKLKREKYKYDLKSVILFPFTGVERFIDWTEENVTAFCSKFVAWIIDNVYGIIDNINITPSDLSDKVKDIDESFTVFEGTLDDFNLELFTDFERRFRDTKSSIERRVKNSIDKDDITFTDMAKEKLITESFGAKEDRKIYSLTNIIYSGHPDDDMNTKYHRALNSILWGE